MEGKAEMERFLMERRRSQKTSLQRILRVKTTYISHFITLCAEIFCILQVPNDNVLCKLKIRHHQTRGALLYGTKQHENRVEEEEEKENEEVEKMHNNNVQLMKSRIHKV